MDFAFSFIIRNGGLDTEKDYKYKAADGVCNINKEKKHVVTIDSYEDVPPNDENALKKVTRHDFSPLENLDVVYPSRGWSVHHSYNFTRQQHKVLFGS